MGMKWYLNEKALEAFAKELRRASWGVGVAAAGGGITSESAVVAIAGGLVWMLLQIAAVALQSIKNQGANDEH